MNETIKIEIILHPSDRERLEPYLDSLLEALCDDTTESAFKWKSGNQSKTSDET